MVCGFTPVPGSHGSTSLPAPATPRPLRAGPVTRTPWPKREITLNFLPGMDSTRSPTTTRRSSPDSTAPHLGRSLLRGDDRRKAPRPGLWAPLALRSTRRRSKVCFRCPISSLRSAFPVLKNPANKNRAVSLTAEQFRYGFGNAIDAAESDELHAKWAIPAPGKPLFQAASAELQRPLRGQGRDR